MFPLRKTSNEIKGKSSYGFHIWIISDPLPITNFRPYIKYDMRSERYTNLNEFLQTVHSSLIKTQIKTENY